MTKVNKQLQIPSLTEKDIKVRVQSLSKTQTGVKARLLLYKDARCDMRILDAVFGPANWKREHKVVNGNLFCTVSIFDENKGEWVSKEDVGTESNTEKEKGQASDAFKRACTNWGIGRELYTPINLWVDLKEGECDGDGRSFRLRNYVKFSVAKIVVSEEKEITDLVIVDNRGETRYSMQAKTEEVEKTAPAPKSKTGKTVAKKKSDIIPPLPRPLKEMSLTQLKAVRNSAHLEYYHEQVDKLLAEMQEAKAG